MASTGGTRREETIVRAHPDLDRLTSGRLVYRKAPRALLG